MSVVWRTKVKLVFFFRSRISVKYLAFHVSQTARQYIVSMSSFLIFNLNLLFVRDDLRSVRIFRGSKLYV